MKQCVAPVSSRMVTRRGPWAVQRSPDNRGLKDGWSRTHGKNGVEAASVASCPCMARASSSTDS